MFRSLFKKRLIRTLSPRTQSLRRRPSARPHLESLEDRCVPTTGVERRHPQRRGNGLEQWVQLRALPTQCDNGRYVAFVSTGTDVVANFVDGNTHDPSAADLFVRDLQTGVTTLVSINRLGTASADDGPDRRVGHQRLTAVTSSSRAVPPI